MRLEQSLPLLGLLLCAVGITAQEDEELEGEFLVEISGTTVTITCPFEDEDIRWELSGRPEGTRERKLVLKDHDSTPANLSCSLGTQTRQLYLNARVCANCEELDALTVAGIIAADLLITLGVLILVHYFSKGRRGRASAAGERRGGGGGGGGGERRPRGQKTQRPPPVPNPDYEPIRKGQREVYAGLEPRGF
ncbi:PREDICTED: T-cell surface glycoprotein CD3 epsilon chain [Ficedula albicollis]|uniref:T-cell surface glycoprotein CD3 epsilon chain n=1 Tax=Ficedula albicollis TaxID=59894 RepID=U3JTY0_FICAL|nr:PREDICTED: T-cell surface glycoprotein CD3 epsilon chain [Ficedula albicollis]XP_016159358.1 PREDICTED: T-cell surface glycoprotein CD3 epsilon chain [Ficedula albicollis]